MTENEPDAIALRKWCLEKAFETRALSGVAHMEVSNVADDYYQWIVSGASQRSKLIAIEEGTGE